MTDSCQRGVGFEATAAPAASSTGILAFPAGGQVLAGRTINVTVRVTRAGSFLPGPTGKVVCKLSSGRTVHRTLERPLSTIGGMRSVAQAAFTVPAVRPAEPLTLEAYFVSDSAAYGNSTAEPIVFTVTPDTRRKSEPPIRSHWPPRADAAP